MLLPLPAKIGGKYKKLQVSERHKNLFLYVRAEAGWPIERVLGQGGFGITYLATIWNLKKQWSLKSFSWRH